MHAFYTGMLWKEDVSDRDVNVKAGRDGGDTKAKNCGVARANTLQVIRNWTEGGY